MTNTYTTGKTTVANGGYSIPSGTVTINTSTTGATGSSSIYTIGPGSGGTGYTWTTTGTGINNPVTITSAPASLDVKGKLIINGVDLEERLKTIEKVLMIPERDVKLEKKYPKLKRLYDEYIKALGKYRTFEAIKGDNDDQ